MHMNPIATVIFSGRSWHILLTIKVRIGNHAGKTHHFNFGFAGLVGWMLHHNL